MNHLDNHPDNLLPNNFPLTLDTHFVASMILFERYGAAPIRVIRKSRRTSTATNGSTTGSATATPTPATSTPTTRTPAAPRRRAAGASWTRPAPACGWATT
jgi:hypothetical protein